MPRIHKSIEIEAPREKVFTEAVDPQKQPHWAIFLKQVDVISGDPQRAGSTQRWAFKVGPRVQELQATVAAFNANEALVRRVTDHFPLEERFLLFPLREDATRVEWTFEYKPPMGTLGLFLDFLVMNRVFQNDVETSLENLKRQLER